MSTPVFALVLCSWCVWGIAGWCMAKPRRRAAEGFWIAFVGGPIGFILAYLFLEDHSCFCPSCNKPISLDAIKCPFCQSLVPLESRSRQLNAVRSESKLCPACQKLIPKTAVKCPVCMADLLALR